MDAQATAGRIVHFYPMDAKSPDDVRAAIVNTDTDEHGTAELTIFTRAGPIVVERVNYSYDPRPGYWSWMPYQKAKAEMAEGNQSESAEPRPGLRDVLTPIPDELCDPANDPDFSEPEASGEDSPVDDAPTQ